MLDKMTLFLISNHYPLGNGEAFLESELPYLAKNFDVTVISLDGNQPQTRELPLGVSLVRYNQPSGFKIILKMITRFANPITKKEGIKGTKKLKAIWALSKAEYFRKFFEKNMLLPYGGAVAYTYWLCYETMGLCFMKDDFPSMRVVTRMHRGDFYETKKDKYLPFRKLIVSHVDKAFVVSKAGENYFNQHYSYNGKNVQISRLGAEKHELKPLVNDGTIYLVSASNMLPIKNIGLIIDALALLKFNINWCHFGDGPLMNKLLKHAQSKLKNMSNITYSFKSEILHDELMEYYTHNRVDIFINTSKMEGIPVSIMEAFSFGIPAIAPDVGAVSEIIDENCGFLLPKIFSPRLLANAITQIAQGDRESLSRNAYEKWDTEYNAQKNYTQFIKDIRALL